MRHEDEDCDDNDNDNGILAQIPGEYIARATNTLPPAVADQDAHAVVEMEVPGLGHVRVKFKLLSHCHRHSRHWFWTATHAELAA
jgi:hypothetical protein